MHVFDWQPVGSGMDFLAETLQRGDAPASFERHLGLRLTHLEPGHVHLCAEPDADCLNPMRTVHGGYLATLLDAAMSASVHSQLQAGLRFTTVEFKVNFMKAASPYATLKATGKVRKAGRRIAFAEGAVYLANDELIASGSATCLIWGERGGETNGEKGG